MHVRTLDRRRFVQSVAFAGLGLGLEPWRTARAARPRSANDRLNIGVVGVAHRGEANLHGVSGENIVALCDVDETLLAAAAQRFPKAATFTDFRRLLDRTDLDAIVCSTPDHTHAVVAAAALRSGRHCYCEKPLTRTVSECRAVREAAAAAKVATQMGTQIHAGANYRRVVELVQAGAIGPVAEVHVWQASRYGNVRRPTDTPPVPAGLQYDLWLGPVEARPYHPDYLPGRWRSWWAFGGGALGDFGCHYLDLPHWALDLRHCTEVEVVDGPSADAESVPSWLVLRYAYPARGTKPPVKLTWYHGGRQPDLLKTILPPEEPKPAGDAKKKEPWVSGVLFVGAKGTLLADYTRHLLLPEATFAGFQPPAPSIPESVGHHAEWIEACKRGGPTTCNFDYSGALTETVLLGNVAHRAGTRLDWDSAALRATNCPKAEEFIRHRYRNGWSL